MDMNQNRKCALTFESCTSDDSPECQVAYWFTKKSLIKKLNIFLELKYAHYTFKKLPKRAPLNISLVLIYLQYFISFCIVLFPSIVHAHRDPLYKSYVLNCYFASEPQNK